MTRFKGSLEWRHGDIVAYSKDRGLFTVADDDVGVLMRRNDLFILIRRETRASLTRPRYPMWLAYGINCCCFGYITDDYLSEHMFLIAR